MVKRLLAGIVTFLYFLTIMRLLIVFSGFSVNIGYIISELCENRAKPESKCNGNCYLMKELKKADDSSGEETPKSSPRSSNKDFVSQHILTQKPSFPLYNDFASYHNSSEKLLYSYLKPSLPPPRNYS